jgi:hypothetical protein
MATTRQITLTEIEADGVSTAVAAGKIVLEAMRDPDGFVRGSVVISDNDLSEEAWAEMEQYLGRRGVALRFDHGGGREVFAVAVTETCPVCGSVMPEQSQARRVSYGGVTVCARATCEAAADEGRLVLKNKTRYAPPNRFDVCPDCGERGERKGHQTCRYPQD